MRLWTGSMTALALAGMLAGCNRASDDAAAQTANSSADANAALPALPAALPMQEGVATSLGAAPAANALPAGAPMQFAALPSPRDSYAYLDRAAGQSDAYGDAPPDYAFDYNGVSPWAWQAGDGSTEYAEPVEGGYRSYYYQPGEDRPYLVRDGDYSYAYAGAALVAIYLGGRLLPRPQWGDHARYAAGYRDRAENLYHAARDDRRGVVAANWAARRDQIAQQRGAWAMERERQADWAAYHREHAVQEQDHWAQDRAQRRVAAQRFDDWRRQDYRGQAPYARPDSTATPQDRQPVARPLENRPPVNREPPRPQPTAQPAFQPAPDRRPDPADDRRDARPPVAAERPAARPAAPAQPVPVADRADRAMLGSDPERMRQHGLHPLAAPDHEPERAVLPRAVQPRPAVRTEGRPDIHPAPETPRAVIERASPHAEAPRPVREAVAPRAAPRPAAHVEVAHPAPHEAPHPAPPHASEPHGDDRHR